MAQAPLDIRQEILTFLQESYLLILGTCEGKNPHTSTLLYESDEDLNFYFLTHTDSQKAQNIQKNPHISFVIGGAIDRFHIQAQGVAEATLDNSLREKIIFKLAQKTNQIEDFWPPILYIKGEGYTVFKIKPTQMKVLDLLNIKKMKGSDPFIYLLP